MARDSAWVRGKGVRLVLSWPVSTMILPAPVGRPVKRWAVDSELSSPINAPTSRTGRLQALG